MVSSLNFQQESGLTVALSDLTQLCRQHLIINKYLFIEKRATHSAIPGSQLMQHSITHTFLINHYLQT